jgi:hypothetical protein
VARAYGYDFEDDAERRHVVALVSAIVTQLADIGSVIRRDGDVILTGLGNALATAAAVMSSDGDLE